MSLAEKEDRLRSFHLSYKEALLQELRVGLGGVNFYGPPARQILAPNGIYILEKAKPKILDIVQLSDDRNVPRKPRLLGGVKGHNIK